MFGIITALPEEAHAVSQHFGLMKNETGLMESQNIKLVQSGVGKVYAAAATAELLANYPEIKLLINIWVAGSLDPTLTPGQVIIGSSTQEYDVYLPTSIDTQGTYRSLELHDPISGDWRRARIATADRFVDDLELKKTLASQGFQVVDMEAAAVARVAALHHVPCLVIKGITDNAQGEAAGDFETNLHTSMQATLGILESLMEVKDSTNRH